MTWFHEHMSATGWEEALRERLDKAQLGALRSRWERGWPLAGDRWIAKTERLLGRRLRPLPVGWQKGRQRPKRKTRIVAAPDQQQQ